MTGYREKGIMVLKKHINKEVNLKLMEKKIYQYCSKSKTDDIESMYLDLVYQTVSDLNKGLKLGEIVKTFQKNLVGWDHPSFKEIKNFINEQDGFIENPFEVAEGTQQCTAVNPKTGKKCNNKKVIYYSRQERGSDEPMTTYNICFKCGHKWKYAG